MARTRKKLSEEEKKTRRREQKKLIMRRLREKLKQNPQALEEKRRKDRDYYHKKKEEGKIKTIKDLAPRDQRKLRKKWREEAKLRREKKKMHRQTERIMNETTPPSSPIPSERSASVVLSSRGSNSRVTSGKYIAARNRRNLKAENLILRCKLKAAQTKISKYRMRENRSKKSECQKTKKKDSNAAKMKTRKTRRYVTEQKVREFLEDDINSRLTAGKKETITRKTVKKQIRYLNDTLLNLYDKFIDTTGSRISYATFCRSRPFWVLSPRVSSRDTCLCALHENTDFIVQALKTSKILEENSALEVAQSLCCGVRMKEICLERRCEDCNTKSLKLAEYNDQDSIYYFRWITKKFPVVIKKEEVMRQKTVKEQVLTNKKKLIEYLNQQMPKFMQHVANIFHQTQAIRTIKNNMSSNTGLLHIDFSENYNCKYAKEVQGAHFAQSKPQLSLHTSVFYYKLPSDEENEKIEHKSFCTVTLNTQHDPVLICAHLRPVINQIKSLVPDIKSMHFLSDGPTTQYRNKKMFLLMVEYISTELNIEELTWHFSESGHGKGAPDGVGGCLKREADAYVALGHDILNPQDFVDGLKERVKNINVIPIDDTYVSDIELRLQQSEVKPFKGTMRIHQLTWKRNKPHVIHARRLSCTQCSADAICRHYEIGQIPITAHSFKQDLNIENNGEEMTKNKAKSKNKKKSKGKNKKITKKKDRKIKRLDYESDKELFIKSNLSRKRWRYFDIYSDSSDDDIPLSLFKKSKADVAGSLDMAKSTSHAADESELLVKAQDGALIEVEGGLSLNGLSGKVQGVLSEESQGGSSVKASGMLSARAENVPFDEGDESSLDIF